MTDDVKHLNDATFIFRDILSRDSNAANVQTVYDTNGKKYYICLNNSNSFHTNKIDFANSHGVLTVGKLVAKDISVSATASQSSEQINSGGYFFLVGTVSTDIQTQGKSSSSAVKYDPKGVVGEFYAIAEDVLDREKTQLMIRCHKEGTDLNEMISLSQRLGTSIPEAILIQNEAWKKRRPIEEIFKEHQIKQVISKAFQTDANQIIYDADARLFNTEDDVYLSGKAFGKTYEERSKNLKAIAAELKKTTGQSFDFEAYEKGTNVGLIDVENQVLPYAKQMEAAYKKVMKK